MCVIVLPSARCPRSRAVLHVQLCGAQPLARPARTDASPVAIVRRAVLAPRRARERLELLVALDGVEAEGREAARLVVLDAVQVGQTKVNGTLSCRGNSLAPPPFTMLGARPPSIHTLAPLVRANTIIYTLPSPLSAN